MSPPPPLGAQQQRRGRALLLCGAVVGIVMAAAGLVREPPVPQSAPSVSSATSPPAGLPSDVVARVNGRLLTRSEFERALAVEIAGGEVSSAATRRRVLDRMIDEELRAQHGVALNLHLNDPRVRMDLATIVAESVVAAATQETDDTHLRSYFEAHRQRFAQRGALRVQHIWVAAIEGNLGEAYTRARTATRLLREGEAFSVVAEITGNKPPRELPSTVLSPDDLGSLVGRAALNAVLTLAPGGVTDPVRDTGGFHVLRVVTRKALSPPTFEAARLDVEAEFAAEEARRALADNAAQLRRSASIEQVEFEP